MHHTPARHPHNPERHPDRAAETPCGDAVAMGQGDAGQGEAVGNDGVALEPCTGDFDPTEYRAYGGVMASKLAGMADKLEKHRLAWGFGPCVPAFCSLTDKIQHALYIYTRVKDAMAYLYAPEEIELDLNSDGDIIPAQPHATRPTFTWDVTPRQAYQRDGVSFENGRDIRGSSLHWIERRVQLVKARARKVARDAYIKDCGLVMSTRSSAPKEKTCSVTEKPSVKKVFEQRSMTTGEIWPPVPIPAKINVEITVKPITFPRPSKGMLSVGRKLGIEFYYNWYYEDPDNIANMWTGEAGELRRQRGPPGG